MAVLVFSWDYDHGDMAIEIVLLCLLLVFLALGSSRLVSRCARLFYL
jgi:hypothetical protein